MSQLHEMKQITEGLHKTAKYNAISEKQFIDFSYRSFPSGLLQDLKRSFTDAKVSKPEVYAGAIATVTSLATGPLSSVVVAQQAQEPPASRPPSLAMPRPATQTELHESKEKTPLLHAVEPTSQTASIDSTPGSTGNILSPQTTFPSSQQHLSSSQRNVVENTVETRRPCSGPGRLGTMAGGTSSSGAQSSSSVTIPLTGSSVNGHSPGDDLTSPHHQPFPISNSRPNTQMLEAKLDNLSRQVRTIETRLSTDIQTIMQLLSHIVAHSGGSLLGNTTTVSKDLVSLSSDLTPEDGLNQQSYRHPGGKPRGRQYRRAVSLQGSLSALTPEGVSLRYMCRSLDLPRSQDQEPLSTVHDSEFDEQMENSKHSKTVPATPASEKLHEQPTRCASQPLERPRLRMVRLNRHLSAEPGHPSSQEWDPPGDVVGGTASAAVQGTLLPPSSAVHITSCSSTSALHSMNAGKTAASERKTTSWDDVSKRPLGSQSSDVLQESTNTGGVARSERALGADTWCGAPSLLCTYYIQQWALKKDCRRKETHSSGGGFPHSGSQKNNPISGRVTFLSSPRSVISFVWSS
ncbi:potassium voltage-gated channel subfamily H member 6 [Caerostris extrusa]|uniref:Potassium voltage-gated channel subfamily H member 6 n=1 Tax=Caerostris extrusa TaxID=172846 RepID=A0AAV4Y9I8_CAEEX|nr:potassium voltage-gated channel subfamily H member 6 [Caerostris extrusa]